MANLNAEELEVILRAKKKPYSKKPEEVLSNIPLPPLGEKGVTNFPQAGGGTVGDYPSIYNPLDYAEQPMVDRPMPLDQAGQIPVSETPNLDLVTGKRPTQGATPPATTGQLPATTGQPIEAPWQPKKQRDLRWLAALGTGLSGIGAAINPQGNVSQATAGGRAILENWEDMKQKNYMYQMANDSKSPLSVLARKNVGVTDPNVSWIMLKEIYGSMMDTIAQNFSFKRQQEISSRLDVPEERRVRAEERKKEEYNIPGWTLMPGFRPENPDKLKTDVSILNTLDEQFDELVGLVKKYGAYEAFGKGYAQMKNLAVNLQLLHKDVFGLGAITGPDMEIINRIADDPSDWKSVFTKNSTMIEQLSMGKKTLDNRMSNKLKAFGFKKNVEIDKKEPSDKGERKAFKGVGEGWLKDGIFTSDNGEKYKIE
jgi:hypothetical protein